MRRVYGLFLLLCGLLLALSACGQTQSIHSTSTALNSVPQRETLYVLDNYTTEGRRVVSFRPGTQQTTALPAGLFSQNHQHIYTATPEYERTRITVTNAHTGRVERTFTIAGSHSTTGDDYTKAVVSTNGRWLALRQLTTEKAQTTFTLVDTEKGILAKSFSLQGNFDLDAVSPDGSRIYLLQRLHDNTGHYYVRRYDVQTGTLVEQIIADKSELNDPRMLGSALTRQMAQDGSTVYTLYTDTRSTIAFVHILPLMSDLNLARCIDLPAGKSADVLRYYTLALSTDGTTLYATNAPLGVTVVINVADKDGVTDTIVKTIRFTPSNAQVSHNEASRSLYNGAALSSDQKTLYAVGLRGIVAIDIANGTIQQNYASEQVFTGIALSTDNKTLYAVSPNAGITLVDLQSGQMGQIRQNSVQAPWGIAWVTAS